MLDGVAVMDQIGRPAPGARRPGAQCNSRDRRRLAKEGKIVERTTFILKVPRILSEHLHIREF